MSPVMSWIQATEVVPLPVEPPISGPTWSVVLPAALLLVASGGTFLLYRCFAAEDRIGTWTQLRTLIDEKFKAAGIVIAFPQRDVHLDTLEPLQVEIHQS